MTILGKYIIGYESNQALYINKVIIMTKLKRMRRLKLPNLLIKEKQGFTAVHGKFLSYSLKLITHIL